MNLPAECGAVDGISYFEQEGTWKVFSEKECSELWGGYSGIPIQQDHRYPGLVRSLQHERVLAHLP